MAQLRSAVVGLMAAVRALPPLSMDAIGAAARLALLQIGCSNPRCDPSGLLCACVYNEIFQLLASYFFSLVITSVMGQL